MDLTHRFRVPTHVAEAWDHFQDLAAVAECFPGAQVTSVDGDSFSGTVKVKLGPIALQYNGSGTFLEKDDTNHRFVVEAKGKDKRGNGTAGATVTLTMSPVGDAATDIEVLTDLSVTGKPAQFGRGVMQDVSDKLLGQFDLVGIPPAPRGVPQIEVTFDIDANGIVNVSARDKGTGKEQQIRIQASGGLSEAEVQKMVRDAEQHAQEDKKRRALVDAKNQAEGLIHTTEKTLSEHAGKIAAADKSTAEAAVAELKSAIASEDVAAIQAKTSALSQVAMKLGEAMYQSDAGAAAGAAADNEEGVVDADFEEVKEDERKKSA